MRALLPHPALHHWPTLPRLKSVQSYQHAQHTRPARDTFHEEKAKKRRKKTASSSQSCHSTWGWLLLSVSIIRVTFRRPRPLGFWLVHDHRGVLANTHTSGTLSGQMNLNRPWPLSWHSTNYDRKSITTNPVYWNIFKHADKIRGIHFNALEANRIITYPEILFPRILLPGYYIQSIIPRILNPYTQDSKSTLLHPEHYTQNLIPRTSYQDFYAWIIELYLGYYTLSIIPKILWQNSIIKIWYQV